MKNMFRLFNNASGIKRSGSFKSLLFMVLCILGVNLSRAQVNGDFQTKSAGGNWSDFNSWNIRSGGSWVAATAGQVPTSTSSVFIQSGHTISVDAATAVCNDLNATGSLTSKVAFSNASSVLNIKGNFVLVSTSHAVFGTWVAGAKLVFSGSGAQVITNQNANYSILNLEINKPAGTFTTTPSSSNLKYDVITLTAGTFNVVSGQELRGLSSSSTITVNGGIWNQIAGATRINGGTGTDMALTINSGTMTLATTSGSAAGFNFSSVSISNGGILNLNNFAGNLNITNSLTIDATSKLNTAMTTTPIPATHTLSGLVNYNHTGVQNIAAATYSNLRLSGTSLKTLAAGTTSIAANGILEMSGVATSPTLALGAGTLSVSATNTTLIYSSTGTQTATATEWSTNFQNLTINNGSVSGVSMAGLNRTINGTVTLTAGILNIGASGTLILNGAALVRTAGFIDGTNTSDFTVTGATGGTVNLPTNANISLRNVTISGTRTLVMNGTHNINLSGAFSIASGATFDTGGESQIIDNGGSVSIDGRFLTRDVEGFTGTNTSIPGIVPTLNSGCTIEYGLAGNQAISIRSDYYNLDFTNSGTKSPVTASSITGIAGTVSIKDAAIVDVSNNSFGNGSTPLTMTGTSRFINGGSGVKPDMGGTYTLGSGTTIEFSLGSVTEIRLAPNYYHVVVSGTNVTLSSASSSVKFQSGGSFTVKNNGIFKVINTNGFSGSTNTAIDNTNTPSIILESGSTIDYSGASQTITNQTINTPSNANYEGLTLSGTGTKTAPATLTVKGNLIKSGTSTFAHNNGTVVLNGSAAQAYTAAVPEMDFYDLTINNTVDLIVNNDLSVKRILAFGANAKLNFGSGNITLRSDASNTANVGQVPATAVIAYGGSGRFIVERYIPTGISHPKSWQFLSAPAVGQTIKEAWMENGLVTSTPNGYGTWITGPGGTGAGFDAGSSTASIKTYVPASDSWATTGNPSTTSINNLRGYMLFVRGDRSVYNLSGANSAAVVTTLRTKGSILTGDQPVITVNANQFESIGNPFASAIDLTQLTLNESGGGVQDIFYVWDPLLTTIGVNSAYGLGGFQTFTRNGTTYDVTPGGGSYAATNKYIQSGQAFFAHAITIAGTVKITESSKANGSSIVTRPVNNITSKQLRTNLYVMKNGAAVLIDGNLVQFDGSYSNTVDLLDALKLNNTGENLGLSRNSKTLVVERRKAIEVTDTLFYKTGQLKIQPYRFEFIPANISRQGLQAFLEDNYLGTKKPVSLTDINRVAFVVNNDPRSYAVDRFRLVFRQKRKTEDHSNTEVAQSNNNHISVYPNPVVDKTIRLVFHGQPEGKYHVQLSNTSGQVILEQDLAVSGNYFSKSLQVSDHTTGVHSLSVSGMDGMKTIIQVIIR